MTHMVKENDLTSISNYESWLETEECNRVGILYKKGLIKGNSTNSKSIIVFNINDFTRNSKLN